MEVAHREKATIGPNLGAVRGHGLACMRGKSDSVIRISPGSTHFHCCIAPLPKKWELGAVMQIPVAFIRKERWELWPLGLHTASRWLGTFCPPPTQRETGLVWTLRPLFWEFILCYCWNKARDTTDNVTRNVHLDYKTATSLLALERKKYWSGKQHLPDFYSNLLHTDFSTEEKWKKVTTWERVY